MAGTADDMRILFCGMLTLTSICHGAPFNIETLLSGHRVRRSVELWRNPCGRSSEIIEGDIVSSEEDVTPLSWPQKRQIVRNMLHQTERDVDALMKLYVSIYTLNYCIEN